MKQPFAERVKAGLVRSGLTLRELCRRSQVDPSLLSKVLAGKRPPPADEKALRRLADALGLPAEELIVSAGVIPAEWSRLNDDPALLKSVSEAIASPKRRAAPTVERAVWGSGLPPVVRTETRSRELQDELL